MKLLNLLPFRGTLRSFTAPILGIAIALASSVAAAATVYDVEDDFSASNPSGPWTYGQYGVAGPAPDTSNFTPFSTYTPDLFPPIDVWNFGPTDPNISHNDSGSVHVQFGITWQPNQVNVSPASTTYAGVRFTAPNTQAYILSSSFANVQSNSAKDVYVYKNNVQVDTFSLGATPHNYNAVSFPLAAGDVVDFVVSGSNNVALDARFQTAWSLADDFSLASNPNGPWGYGTASANAGLPDTSTFAAFATSEITNIGGVLSNTLEYWHNGASNNVDPGISHNQHGTQVTCCGSIIWEPNQVNFSGANGPGYVDATWTAPATGQYTVDANFFNAQVAASANVFVYLNGTQLFAGMTGNVLDYLAANGATYDSAVLNLTAGDVLHFLVDGGNNVAVSALINPVPEPTSIALLALGMVVGTRLARRRRS